MKRSLLAVIPLLMVVTISNAYASGPRLDVPDPSPTPESGDCWVDGYDAGFAGKYDNDRARECLEKGADSYNASWDGACLDGGGGRTENECNDIMNNPQDLESHEELQEENRRNCYDDGFEDGENSNSFDKDRDSACSEYGNMYEDGFSAGCQSVKSNTYDSCRNGFLSIWR